MKRGGLSDIIRNLFCEKRVSFVRAYESRPLVNRSEAFLGYRALCQPKYMRDGKKSKKAIE